MSKFYFKRRGQLKRPQTTGYPAFPRSPRLTGPSENSHPALARAARGDPLKVIRNSVAKLSALDILRHARQSTTADFQQVPGLRPSAPNDSIRSCLQTDFLSFWRLWPFPLADYSTGHP